MSCFDGRYDRTLVRVFYRFSAFVNAHGCFEGAGCWDLFG